MLPHEPLVKVFAREKHRGRCRDCGEALLWTRTVHHPRPLPFPIDIAPAKVGVDQLTREPVEYYRMRACHYETCPTRVAASP